MKLARLSGKMNEEVDDYLKRQKSPQREICQKLRETIFETIPSVKEGMKWGVPTYADGKYYIARASVKRPCQFWDLSERALRGEAETA